MVVNDSHVHMGWWRTFNEDGIPPTYYSPREIVRYMDESSIDQFCVSSTSSQKEGIRLGDRLDEYREICEIAESRCHPLNWLNVNDLNDDPDMKKCMPDDVPWCGLKLHNEASHWLGNVKILERAMSIAWERDWCVQFHTGGGRSDARLYIDICKKFSDVAIDLAHGRPPEEAIAVANACPNVYIDISFAPDEWIEMYAAEPQLRDRIMFGSDVPVTIQWYGSNVKAYMARRIESVRSIFRDNTTKVLSENFNRFVEKKRKENKLWHMLQE